jgi:threonine dehydrogenase-like Zn-dependent dehydrogenase
MLLFKAGPAMRGVVFLGDRKLAVQNFPDPAPSAGEVVLAIKASGMCGSDLKHYRAAAGSIAPEARLIAGHEPCGVVVAVGVDVPSDCPPVGARVMVHHYKGCGRCKHCRGGWSQLCRGGITVYGITGHGGHADFMKVPATTLVPLPDELSFEEGAAISCGTGTAYAALGRIEISRRETLAIFGQGPVGLSATTLGRAMGARIIAVDVSAERLELAQRFGADAVVNPTQTDPVTAIHALTDGEGAEATMDCTGVSEARIAAVRSAGTWGRVALVGEGGTTAFDVSQHLLRRQLTLHASWTFSTIGQAECARFIVDRKLPLKNLLTHRFKLEDAEAAYKLFDTQTTGKGVFVFS